MKYFIYSLITITICLLIQTNAFAQDEETRVPTKYKYAVKFSPLSLLPLPLPSMQLGLEHKLKNERHAFQHELGALFPYPYHLFNNNFKRMGGFRATSGYRYYLNKPTHRFNFFTSAQYRLQYESWDLESWFSRDGGSYRQLIDYKKRVMSHGALALIGGNKKARYSNFLFEWEIGFGVKSRTVFNRGLPSDIVINNFDEGDFFPLLSDLFNPTNREDSNTNIIPLVHCALKFGFVIP